LQHISKAMLISQFLSSKSRGCLKQSRLFSFIVVPLIVFGCPAIAELRPSVFAQRFDDDCGISALRMLLQRAGQQVSDAQLFAAISPSTDVEALSSRDLQRVVEALGLGYSLDIGYTDAATATDLTEFEAFMVLIKPTAMIGLSTINHFVLVEGATEEGWLVADPILADRVIFPYEDIQAKLVGRELDGTTYPMILRLTKDAQGAAASIAILETDLERMTWTAAYNKPRSLQKGKTVINFGASLARIDIKPGFGLSEMITGQTLSFGATRGLSPRTMGRFNLNHTITDVTVSALGASVSFRLDESISFSFGLDHLPKVDLPNAFALSTSTDVSWDGSGNSTSLSVGAQFSYVDENWTFGLGAGANYDGTLQGQMTPSVGYTKDFEKASVDLTLSLPTDLQTGDTDVSINVVVLKPINNDLSLQFSGGLSGNPGSDVLASSVSMQVVYAIPRLFRRAN
jgi:hypothetical protein